MTDRFPFSTFPNGWFRVAYSDELAPGSVKPLYYFGQDWVLFRTEMGEAQLLAAHCPHLGAHLGYGGYVEKETICCPFHGWQFDAKGRCVAIPRSQKPPLKTQIQSLPICEWNGLILAYYHNKIQEPDQAPDHQPPWHMPTLPGWNSLTWTAFQRRRWKIQTHPQEMAENAFDTAHMLFLHGQSFRQMRHSRVEASGATLTHHLQVQYRLSLWKNWGIDAEGLVEISSHGLGCQVSYTQIKAILEFEAISLFLLTPIDGEFLDVHVLVSTKHLLNPLLSQLLRQKSMAEVSYNLEQDIPIWEHKCYRDQPPLSDVDGPIHHYRRWAQQFYNNVETMRSGLVTV